MMPQVLVHPPETDENTQETAKHRYWLPYHHVFGGPAGRPQQPPTLPEPSAPVNVDLPTIAGTAQQGQTLLCDPGTWEYEPTEYTFVWMRGSTTVGTQAFYQCVAADVGSTLICAVTAINVVGSTVADSAPTSSVLPNAPSNTAVPVITGTLQVGATLTCSSGTWTGSPAFAYQWMRGGIQIGTNQNTYVLVAADANMNINCIVTATNAGGSNTAQSTFMGPILPAAPTNSVAPVVSSPSLSVASGDSATTTNGTWTGSPTFTYQWLRNTAPISGSTSQTHLLVPADEGFNLSCMVTARNVGGSTNMTSNSIGPVTP